MWSFWTSMNQSTVPAWSGNSGLIACILLCKSCYFCPLEEVNRQGASRLGLSDSTVRRWGGGVKWSPGCWRNQRYKSQMTSAGDIREPLNRLFQIFTWLHQTRASLGIWPEVTFEGLWCYKKGTSILISLLTTELPWIHIIRMFKNLVTK